MMGEVGFSAQGIDWTEIPVNFTWSRNLNLQLTARERHGVLFFIEQGLMPRTGKRYEWEVAAESGDPLAALFQDFERVAPTFMDVANGLFSGRCPLHSRGCEGPLKTGACYP